MTIHAAHPPSPGPTVTPLAPADGAAVSRSVPPAFSWSASAAVGYELHFAGSSVVHRVRKLPRRRDELLTATSYTPSANEWRRMTRLADQVGGATLYWWPVAVDTVGARRSAPLRSVELVP